MFGDDEYTYADVEEDSARVANGLRSLGVTKGCHVALILHNSPEYLWAWFGAARVGAPVVPVNTALESDGLVHIVENSDAQTLRAPRLPRPVRAGSRPPAEARAGRGGRRRRRRLDDVAWTTPRPTVPTTRRSSRPTSCS
ncbi:MAG: ATP-dependent acyl-CoA ligase [Actinobacteria bacterium]|nr:ATP-dependent acyl-CoA ligase [Actinomycetota bacterium]